MNLIEILKNLLLGSGPAWVVALLLALAMVGLAVTLERTWFFRVCQRDLLALSRRLVKHLAGQDLTAARSLLRESRSVAGRVAAAGLRVAHVGPTVAEKAMQAAAAVERERLQARLAFLGTLGDHAPFVGLFGTVVGIIQAFGPPGTGGGSGQPVSHAVMAGIAGALIATAVGIAVALPALAFHSHFQRRIAGLLAGTEAVSSVVLAYLLAEAPPGGRKLPDREAAETTSIGLAARAALLRGRRARRLTV